MKNPENIGRRKTYTVAKGERGLYVKGHGETYPLIDGEDVKPGEKIKAFVYQDKNQTFVATTKKPFLEVGEVALLPIVAKTKIGAFVNIGLDKDVLFPFSEQRERIREGEKHLFRLYVDRSLRLAVTMDIKETLSTDHSYKEGDEVEAVVYHYKRDFGLFVAVDGKYDGLVPQSFMQGLYSPGEKITARVVNRLDDGKLTLTMRKKAKDTRKSDSEHLADLLEAYGGKLPVGDKSDPEEIKAVTGLSKSAYKKAAGLLYKQGLAKPGENELSRTYPEREKKKETRWKK